MSDTPIIFDLGKVLVDYDYQLVFDFLHMQGGGHLDPDTFARKARFDLYESGQISDQEFYTRVLAQVPEPFSFADWARVWTSIFTPDDEMLALFDKLHLRYPVFILSNIGPLHFEYLERRVGLSGRCRGVLTSWRAGVMKPSAQIYTRAEREFGVSGEHVTFIDDREDNVAAARAAGWRAIHHESPAATTDALRQMGIRI